MQVQTTNRRDLKVATYKSISDQDIKRLETEGREHESISNMC